jgi:hypothetical protein
VDQNGAVNTLDATTVLRASIGLVKLTPTQKLLADANGDGTVNTLDAILILRRAVGLVNNLGFVTVSSKVQILVQNNETILKWPATGKKTAGVKFDQVGGASFTIGLDIEPMGDGSEGCVITKTINHVVSDALYGNGYAYFKDFVPNLSMTADVLVADSIDGPFTDVDNVAFTPVAHVYAPGVFGDDNPEITLDQSFPDTANKGDTITVSGKVLTQFADGSANPGLRADSYYIPPTGIPEAIQMESAIPFDNSSVFGPKLLPGSDFKFQFQIAGNGPNIVEINDYSGTAALNRTIYVGGGIPLIPGVLDYRQNPDSVDPAAFDVNAAKQTWLNLINQDRVAYGLNPVTLDDKLSVAGQAHTDDMVKNNYFGHIGLDGSDPNSRAIAAGVPLGTSVGENLAESGRVVALEANLMASAVHRSDLLNPQWTKVGLGITMNADKYLIGAQEFGADAGQYEIAPDFFSKITLDGPIPSAYETGKTYTISGVADASAKNIIVLFQNAQTQHQVVFPSNYLALPDDHRFSIDVKFDADQTGVYLMAIILDGASGNASYIVVNPPGP